MSLSNAFENGLVDLIFNNVDITLVGDAAGLQNSATAGSLYVSLHTSDPGEAGNQTTNEATYTSYARIAVARTSGGWTVATNTAQNTAAVDFAECTGGTNTITHFGIGTDSTGTGKLIASGVLDASRAVSSGITPSFAINAITFTFD